MFDSVTTSAFCRRRVAGALPVELFDQRQSRRPFALLKEGIEQQMLGSPILRPHDDESA
jgi:hypothetical protein